MIGNNARRGARYFWLPLLLGISLLSLGGGASLVKVARDVYWMQTTDFALYVRAARAISSGEDPYDSRIYAEGRDPRYYGAVLEKGDPYAYSPELAEIIACLLPLGGKALRVTWWVFEASSVIAAVVILFRGFGVRAQWPWIVLTLGLMFAGRLLRSDLYHGQANLPLLLALTLGLKATADRRPIAAGLSFAPMLVCKPFLGVIVLYLFWKREWRAAAVATVASGLLLALSFLPELFGGQLSVAGWLATSRYYSTPPFAARPDNQALYGLFLRLFTRENNPFTQPWAQWGAIVTTAMFAGIIALGAVAIGSIPYGDARPSTTRARGLTILLESGVVLSFAFALGPLTQGDYLFYLLPAFVGVLLVTVSQHSTSTGVTAWRATTGIWLFAFLPMCLPWLARWGLESGATWIPISGWRILLTGRVGVTFLVAGVALALTLRSERSVITT